mmetsp:Transcript_36197/g.107507  ORF Transcript_36197/g.107507 Transcript_36197/m.107507 type:complete len:222 (-) Transcript_36197:35-700(-)
MQLRVALGALLPYLLLALRVPCACECPEDAQGGVPWSGAALLAVGPAPASAPSPSLAAAPAAGGCNCPCMKAAVAPAPAPSPVDEVPPPAPAPSLPTVLPVFPGLPPLHPYWHSLNPLASSTAFGFSAPGPAPMMPFAMSTEETINTDYWLRTMDPVPAREQTMVEKNNVGAATAAVAAQVLSPEINRMMGGAAPRTLRAAKEINNLFNTLYPLTKYAPPA